MSDLADMQFAPLHENEIPVSEAERSRLLAQVPGWQVIEMNGVKQLQRIYTFDDFIQALAFANRVGELAEANDHHPALLIEWGKVTVNWWTHTLGGLHHNDFISAAKTDQLYLM